MNAKKCVYVNKWLAALVAAPLAAALGLATQGAAHLAAAHLAADPVGPAAAALKIYLTIGGAPCLTSRFQTLITTSVSASTFSMPCEKNVCM